MYHLRQILILVFCVLFFNFSWGQEIQFTRFSSTELGDERQLQIYLPKDFGKDPNKTYPLTVILDSEPIFDAYLEGRTLIVNQAPLSEILAKRDLIMETWEKVVAAVTIHYINDVTDDMKAIIDAGDATVKPGSDAAADYENHWGEMRGYANGLLYNDFKKIDQANLTRLLIVMGTAPVYPNGTDFDDMQAYHTALTGEVKAILKASYGFSDANMNSW